MTPWPREISRPNNPWLDNFQWIELRAYSSHLNFNQFLLSVAVILIKFPVSIRLTQLVLIMKWAWDAKAGNCTHAYRRFVFIITSQYAENLLLAKVLIAVVS